MSAGLHHHRDELDARNDVAPVLAEWLERTSAALRRLHSCDPREAEAFGDLDAVRLEFDRATSALGVVGDRIRGGLEAQVGNLESLRVDLQEAVAALEQRAEAVQRRVQRVEQDRVALRGELSAAQQDAQALRESASWRITGPLRAVYRLFR